jgi:hypothetical protein
MMAVRRGGGRCAPMSEPPGMRTGPPQMRASDTSAGGEERWNDTGAYVERERSRIEADPVVARACGSDV